MNTIATLIGGLIPIALLTALFLFLFKSWPSWQARLLTASGISLLSATLLAGMGMADGGAFAPVQAFSTYVIPQAIVSLFFFWRLKTKAALNETSNS